MILVTLHLNVCHVGPVLSIGFAASLCSPLNKEGKAVVPLVPNASSLSAGKEIHISVEWTSLPFFEINNNE